MFKLINVEWKLEKFYEDLTQNTKYSLFVGTFGVFFMMIMAMFAMNIIHQNELRSLQQKNSHLKNTVVALESKVFNEPSYILSASQRKIVQKYDLKLKANLREKTIITLVQSINYISRVSLDQDFVKKIAAGFYDAGQKYNVNPFVLVAMSWHENRFNPIRRSNVGARGLMQIMPFWVTGQHSEAKAFRISTGINHIEELDDPVKNIFAGAYIYNRYRNYWIDRGIKNKKYVMTLALLTYNRGPRAIHSSFREGVSPENGYSLVVKRKLSLINKRISI